MSALGDAVAFLEGYLTNCNVPRRVIQQLSVAMEELFVNVANYAYPEKDGTVALELDAKDGKVTLQMSDHGIPFDPLQKPDPDTTLSVEDRPIGGLGIYMVKKTMDNTAYEYRDGQNILTITKNF